MKLFKISLITQGRGKLPRVKQVWKKESHLSVIRGQLLYMMVEKSTLEGRSTTLNIMGARERKSISLNPPQRILSLTALLEGLRRDQETLKLREVIIEKKTLEAK